MQARLIGIPLIFVGYRNTKNGQDLLFETEQRPVETLLPPAGYEKTFDPARSVGRIQRILDALREFSESKPENTVWRAHISAKGGLEVEEVPPNELDLDNRIGIVRRDAVERIRDLELV